MKKLVQAIILTACFGFGVTAHASIITFNGTASESFYSVLSSYSEAGYDLNFYSKFNGASVNGYTLDNNNHPNVNAFDDDVLLFNTGYTITHIEKDDGGLFDAQSFIVGSITNPSQLVFEGINTSGDVISSIVGATVGATDLIMLAGFTNLVSLELYKLSGTNAVIDNLTLTAALPSTSAVPEPATLALFGIGLAGLGFARKKRKSA